MASNRHQRAGALGGRSPASDRQKSIARQTILTTQPWKTRYYRAAIVLSSLPDIEAIEALFSRHGFRALVTVSTSSEGYRITVTVIQRRDFSLDDIEKITEILEILGEL